MKEQVLQVCLAGDLIVRMGNAVHKCIPPAICHWAVDTSCKSVICDTFSCYIQSANVSLYTSATVKATWRLSSFVRRPYNQPGVVAVLL